MQEKWFERILITAAIIGVVALVFANIVYAAGTVCQIGNGCTGTSTSPSYGQLLVGNSSGGYNLTATSSLGISGGGSSASSTLLADNNSWTGIDNISNASSNFAGTWQTFSPSHFQTAGTYLTAFGNYASTTGAAISISTSTETTNGVTQGMTIAISPNGILFTPTISGTLSNAGLAHSTITVNSTTLTLGDTNDTLTAASSSLLSNNNTFSGKNIFGAATSSSFADTALSSALVLTASDGAFENYGGASACSSNNFVTTISALGATTCGTASISGINLGSNLDSLSNDGATLSGSSYNGSASVSNWAINLTNSNQWTASTTFTKVVNQANASTSLQTNGTIWIPSLGTPAGAFLAVDPNGKVLATTTPSGGGGSGTVTQVNTTYPVTGGPFTTSGTIALAFGTTTANSWSALQMLNGQASTTQLSVFNNSYFGGNSTTTISSTGAITTPLYATSTFNGGLLLQASSTFSGALTAQDTDNSWYGILSPTHPISLPFATSTEVGGTSTAPYVFSVVAPYNGKVVSARCFATTTNAFINAQLAIGAALVSPDIVASNTYNTITFTGNNTFTAGQLISLLYGTSTLFANDLGGGCTLYTVQTS